jgi:hypothetical protein
VLVLVLPPLLVLVLPPVPVLALALPPVLVLALALALELALELELVLVLALALARARVLAAGLAAGLSRRCHRTSWWPRLLFLLKGGKESQISRRSHHSQQTGLRWKQLVHFSLRSHLAYSRQIYHQSHLVS